MHDEIDSKKLWTSEADFINLFSDYFIGGFSSVLNDEVELFFEIL